MPKNGKNIQDVILQNKLFRITCGATHMVLMYDGLYTLFNEGVTISMLKIPFFQLGNDNFKNLQLIIHDSDTNTQFEQKVENRIQYYKQRNLMIGQRVDGKK